MTGHLPFTVIGRVGVAYHSHELIISNVNFYIVLVFLRIFFEMLCNSSGNR